MAEYTFGTKYALNMILLKLKSTFFIISEPRISNYYDITPAGEWGIEEHLDKGLITLLMQDNTGGLEVKYKNEWYPVKSRAR